MPPFSYRINAEAVGEFNGTNPEHVRSFFEGQRTEFSCWAACLSNAMLALGTFCSRDSLISRFQMDTRTRGPGTAEFSEMIDMVFGDATPGGTARRRCQVIEHATFANFAPVLAALDTGHQVILGVHEERHVVNLLAYLRLGTLLTVIIFDPATNAFRTLRWSQMVTEAGTAGTVFIL